MARAKRTDRAAARRRYRAALQAEDELATTADEASNAQSASNTSNVAKASTSPRGGTPSTAARVGIGTAFRLAFRPLDLRGDLLALPDLAIHTKALWLPSLLVIASTVAFAITGGKDVVTQFMFAYFIQTPAIGGVFLAGFLATRASWLLGAIVGSVSATCYAILILTVFSAVVAASPDPSVGTQTILGAFLLSPVMGAFFAAAAAWYRRFLTITNPNRAKANPNKAQKADGRTRSAGTQKAGTAPR